jgi:hypothetical protein
VVQNAQEGIAPDIPAAVSGFGTEVGDPVRFGGDGHVVLDDDDGVAFIDKAVEDVDEAADVFLVEACGGFFDQIEWARARRVGDRLAKSDGA